MEECTTSQQQQRYRIMDENKGSQHSGLLRAEMAENLKSAHSLYESDFLLIYKCILTLK